LVTADSPCKLVEGYTENVSDTRRVKQLRIADVSFVFINALPGYSRLASEIRLSKTVFLSE
jgi:hypothetical protein